MYVALPIEYAVIMSHIAADDTRVSRGNRIHSCLERAFRQLVSLPESIPFIIWLVFWSRRSTLNGIAIHNVANVQWCYVTGLLLIQFPVT
jgi:hypothetical protein